MLKIWGRKNSVNVQKVLWCCEEIAVEYQRIDAGGDFGIVKTSQYLSLNPNALVPTIEDEGLVLWESNAIVRYLAAKHATGSLWPDDLKSRAEADQWMDWSSSTFWPALRPLFIGLIRTPANQRDPYVLEDLRRKAAAALAIVDRHLESRMFLAGDNFTVSDIALGCGVWRWMALPIERPSLPNVQRWFDSLADRPAYKKIVMLPLS